MPRLDPYFVIAAFVGFGLIYGGYLVAGIGGEIAGGILAIGTSWWLAGHPGEQ